MDSKLTHIQTTLSTLSNQLVNCFDAVSKLALSLQTDEASP